MSRISEIRKLAESNLSHVASLGEWPSYVYPQRAIMDRIPTEETPEQKVPGFDAGVAVSLGMIPRPHLAAALHAVYTPKRVEQVQHEYQQLQDARTESELLQSLNLETSWWLLASSVCKEDEGGVNAEAFLHQIEDFKALKEADAETKKQAIVNVYKQMTTSFESMEDDPDVCIGKEDGCLQGMYLAGHKFGVFDARAKYGIFFVGTMYPSLGLESFEWGSEVDSQGRPKSGMISPQFVKCADVQELKRALEVVKAHFSG